MAPIPALAMLTGQTLAWPLLMVWVFIVSILGVFVAAALITPEWPAPAVATWKAVAESLAGGLSSLPPSAIAAIVIAAPVGFGLAILERVLPAHFARVVPSAPAAGLAFVIPAWNSISLFLGAALAALFAHAYPVLARRFTLPVAAGLVAGESLMGIATVAIHLF